MGVTYLLSSFYLELESCDETTPSKSITKNPGRRAAEWNPGQVVYTHVPLSPSSIIWYQLIVGDCSAAGKVTAGLAESNGSLPPRFMASDFGHLRADCRGPGSAPEVTLRSCRV